MAVNKVVYGNTDLIDLTNDTVTAQTLASGYTAHDSAGNEIVGTLSDADLTELNTKIDGVSTSIGTTTDTGGSATAGTVMGKLNYLANKSPIKSIQRGITSVDVTESINASVTINSIDPSKSIVILNGNTGGGTSVYEAGVAILPYIYSLTSTTIEIHLSITSNPRYLTNFTMSWQVIEFY